MAGFGNALSFKKITDEHIAIIEDFMRKNAFEYLTKEFCDVSMNNEYEVDIDDELLINYFGPLYAHNTESFQFRPGDKIRIKEIVNYVKSKVDEGGPNKHLSFFTSKQQNDQQRRNKNTHAHKNAFASIVLDENKLKHELIEKVVKYFKQADISENHFGEIAKVHIADAGNVYGDIFCAICKSEHRKNQKAKRVYFNYNGKSKGVWVLSNFVKHLENVHKLKLQHSKKANASSLNGQIDCEDKTESDFVEQNNENKCPNASVSQINSEQKRELDCMEKDGDNDASLIVIDDKELKRNIEENKNCDTPALLYSQMSTQITKVMTAVYQNNEERSDISFFANEHSKKLTVVMIAKDGNCLFGSTAHQLFCYPLNSKEHREVTKKMRADVVAHILDPNNFQLYLHALKDRVYAQKNANEITDIEMECKMFVRHALSQNRFWAGVETLLAISELYETNVIVYNEDDKWAQFKHSGRKFNRSIVVAHRIGGSNEKGEAMRNHYDSVCEIESADLYAVAHSI